jgi:signal transduction histidine kinase
MHGELFMDSVFELMPKNNKNQQFNLKLDPPYLELSEPHSTHLYRIIQELFTNNLKYAKASKTTIEVALKNDLLTLNYVDDGVGQSDFKKGTGIKSIEDRITLLKGNLKINTEAGFAVHIEIPYTA